MIRWTLTAGWVAAQKGWQSRWKLEGEEETVKKVNKRVSLVEFDFLPSEAFNCSVFLSVILSAVLVDIVVSQISIVVQKLPHRTVTECTEPSGVPGCLFLQELKLLPQC